VSQPSLPSILLSNVQSLEHTMDDLRFKTMLSMGHEQLWYIMFQRVVAERRYTDNPASSIFSVHQQNREATSVKTKGGGVCLVGKY
jgi:hypothetical protein